MKRYLTQLLPILVIGSFAAGTALADCPKDGKAGECKDRDQWLQELNLSAEQKEQLTAIKEKYHDDMKKHKQAMKASRESLQAALKTDASDASLRKQFKAMQEQRAQFASLRFEKVLAIRAILTPDQRKKFEGMRRHHRHHHDR